MAALAVALRPAEEVLTKSRELRPGNQAVRQSGAQEELECRSARVPPRAESQGGRTDSDSDRGSDETKREPRAESQEPRREETDPAPRGGVRDDGDRLGRAVEETGLGRHPGQRRG